MNRRLAVAGSLALVAATIGAGCGGGDDSTSTGATGASGATGAQGAPLSKSAFLAKGNAICKNGNQTLDQKANQYFKNVGNQPSSAQFDKFANETAIPSIQAQITAIEGLTPPSADEDQVNAITDAAQQALDKVKSDPSLLQQNGSSDPFADVNKLAKQYGLDECAGGN